MAGHLLYGINYNKKKDLIENMKIYSLPVVFCCFLVSHCFLQPQSSLVKIISQQDITHFSIINERIIHTGTDACVQKVTDGTDVFIIKQINDPSVDEQFLLINDVIASTIGCRSGIPVNEVSFIPYNVGSHLKIYPERAATLHAYISGKDLESELPGCADKEFTLQQRVINPGSPWQIKYPLAGDQQGLTRSIIETMSMHEKLSSLVALDTFTGNSDRSLPNIFYNKKKNAFYGIDQAAAFTKRLPSFAYDRLNEFVSEGYFYNCSVKIIDSLGMYKDMLVQLCNVAPPVVIIQSMQRLVSHLSVNNAEQSDIISARMRHHGCIVEKNYCDALKLIELLDQILDEKCLGKQ